MAWICTRGGHLEAWRACLDLPASGEPLLVNGDGEALEGATTNLFAWFEGALHTPPADGRLLPGVTRAAVLTLARSRGIAVWERPLRAADLSAAEEVWCTSALLPVARARSLDGTPLGCAGRLTSAWLAALEEVTP
jgi:branched-subunit amino acid aminotransferase/4-amino-4-deoxychorismate lyase